MIHFLPPYLYSTLARFFSRTPCTCSTKVVYLGGIFCVFKSAQKSDKIGRSFQVFSSGYFQHFVRKEIEKRGDFSDKMILSVQSNALFSAHCSLSNSCRFFFSIAPFSFCIVLVSFSFITQR
jgi:hypothetical protein